MKYKISVIVPTYNAGEHFYQCLQSILSQSLKALEIIIIDDASNDNAIALIEPLIATHKQRIQLVRLPKHVGLGEARNIGLSYARGDYIGFVGSDDFIEADMFKIMHSQALAEKADVVSVGVRSFEQQEATVQGAAINLNSHFNDTFVFNKIFNRALLEFHHIHFYANQAFQDEPFVYMAKYYSTKTLRLNNLLYHARTTQQVRLERQRKAKFNLYDKQLMLTRLLKDLQKRALLEGHEQELAECLASHALNAINEPVYFWDLLGMFSFIDFLLNKYSLLESTELNYSNEKINRFLQYRQGPLKLLLLRFNIKINKVVNKTTNSEAMYEV